MKKGDAINSLAEVLNAQAAQAAQHAAKILDGRGKVTMAETNHTIDATALLDAAIIELAHDRAMDKLRNPHMYPHMYPKREEWTATAPTPPNTKNAAAYPPMPGAQPRF